MQIELKFCIKQKLGRANVNFKSCVNKFTCKILMIVKHKDGKIKTKNLHVNF